MVYIDLPDGHPWKGTAAGCGPSAIGRAAPSGWTCPSCGHSYAPWVPECHHCPQPPAVIAKDNDPGPVEVGRP